MQGELYRGTLIPASAHPDRGAVIVYATKESNCYAVWLKEGDEKQKLILWCENRNEAIETAVHYYDERKGRDFDGCRNQEEVASQMFEGLKKMDGCDLVNLWQRIFPSIPIVYKGDHGFEVGKVQG